MISTGFSKLHLFLKTAKYFPIFQKFSRSNRFSSILNRLKNFFDIPSIPETPEKLRFSSNSLEIQTDFVKTLKYFWKCDISKVHKISRNVQVISQTFLKPPGKSNRFLSTYYTDPSIFLQKF